MRRSRTGIKHGKMLTPPNPIWEWRAVKRPNLVLYPPSIWPFRRLRYFHLGIHRERSRSGMLFSPVGIVFGLETLEVHAHVALGHLQALVPQNLFHGVDIDSLINHL